MVQIPSLPFTTDFVVLSPRVLSSKMWWELPQSTGAGPEGQAVFGDLIPEDEKWGGCHSRQPELVWSTLE